jgi:cell division septum initiation protein DivIVA
MRMAVGAAFFLLPVVASAAGEGVSREEFDALKKHVEQQAQVIGQLRGRIAVLEAQVKQLRDAEKTAQKSTAEGKPSQKAPEGGSDGGPVKEVGASLKQIPTDGSRWVSEHYVRYDWIQREGWEVPAGQQSGAVLLKGHKHGKRSRLLLKQKLDGDWAARLILRGGEGVWLELVQNRRRKNGFKISLPDNAPVRLDLRRKDGEISAQVNNRAAQITEKRYGGDPEKPLQLAICVRSGKQALLRSVEVYAEK